MSTGGAFGGNRGVRPVPPEKGIFPLDHLHECDLEKKDYLNCLKSAGHLSEKCRQFSRKYLECRMENFMLVLWGGYSIIGFGDIILPGLVVAFALRYDWLTKKTLKTGYFIWAMTAYGLGLLVTYAALNLMDGHGQPALLYIVPFTLGTFLTLGKKRGELKILWTRGEPERPCPHFQLAQPSQSQHLH